jgi:hypothetical protein
VTAIPVDAAAATPALRTLGPGAGQACGGSDARLSNSRTPTAHAGSHAAGQADAVSPVAIGAVPTSRTITAGTGLTGGGDLTADRALAVAYGTTSTTAARGDMAVNLTENQTVAGVKTFSAQPLISSGGSAGAGSRPPATELYVQSRGFGLLTNGHGQLRNNYNFSSCVYDATEVAAGFGSFKINVAQQLAVTTELIAVDAGLTYAISGYIKSGNADGTLYNAANVQYVGVKLLDADALTVNPVHCMKYAGATDTTLAVQLNNGDTTIALTSATGWYNGAAYSNRFISWWPYSNANGNTWANYSYSRNVAQGTGTSGLWGAGGISGNTITLLAPWAGGHLPAGTPVRNASGAGGTYKYCTNISNTAVPNAWTLISGYIGGLGTSEVSGANQFLVGATSMQLVFLVNYHNAADNMVRYSGMLVAPRSMNVVAVPASSTASGIAGQVAYDANYSYICVAANAWKRAAIAAW